MKFQQETLGVPVITYGPTRDFPAFYSGLSNFKVLSSVISFIIINPANTE